MPSEEYCRDLLEKANGALDAGIDALGELFKDEGEMEDNAGDSMRSWAKVGPHLLTGEWADAFADIVDASGSRGKFERSANDVDRALDKFNGADGKFRDAMRAWCEECGQPPDDIDTSNATYISFDESEVNPIVSHPR